MKVAISLLFSLFLATSSLGHAIQEVNTECGGVVTIFRNQSSVISYKENVTLVSEERCVWSIVPEDGLLLSSITLKMEQNGFENSDFTTGFIFYTWTERGIFDGEHIWVAHNGNEFTYQTSQGFLSFSSDFSLNPTAQGFRLAVSGAASESGSKVETRQVLNFPARIPNACEDGVRAAVPNELILSYPPFPAITYGDNTKLAYVIHREGTWAENSLTVDYLDTEEGLDILEVYSLRAYHYRDVTHHKNGIYSGKHGQFNETSSSYEARIVLFSSDSTGTGRGFNLKWVSSRRNRV